LKSWERLFILFFFGIGLALRFLWPADMEWKHDEQWTYAHAQAIAQGREPWPAVGQPTSASLVNFPLGLWLLAGFSRFAHTPVGLMLWVPVLNSIALLAFLLWSLWAELPPDQRETWLWAMTMSAVSPLPILWSRKIWIQDMLIPFTFLIFIGHQRRRNRWGAFLWGLAGAAIGQIHPSGIFFSLGMMGYFLWDERAGGWREVSWVSWLLGSTLGCLPLLPWLHHVVVGHAGALNSRHTSDIFTLHYYTEWIGIAFGINLRYSISDAFWSHFLREPLLWNRATYLMVPVHLWLVGCALYASWSTGKAFWKTPHDIPWHVKAMLLGMGPIISMTGNVISHYLTVAIPFMFLWAAWSFRQRPGMLKGLVVAQFLVSLTFLNFIHQNGGSPNPQDDYGVCYRLKPSISSSVGIK
jgi:hypothetical protein